MSNRLKGVVKQTILTRGFGFIIGDNKKEYFFHVNEVPVGIWETLRKGQRVEFSEQETAKGVRATEVTLL